MSLSALGRGSAAPGRESHGAGIAVARTGRSEGTPGHPALPMTARPVRNARPGPIGSPLEDSARNANYRRRLDGTARPAPGHSGANDVPVTVASSTAGRHTNDK
jgi:hypothetical protein